MHRFSLWLNKKREMCFYSVEATCIHNLFKRGMDQLTNILSD